MGILKGIVVTSELYVSKRRGTKKNERFRYELPTESSLWKCSATVKKCWEGQGARTRVILVIRECIWNMPTVSLVLSAFDDTGSPGYPFRRVVY